MARAIEEVDPEARGTDNTSVKEYERGVREPGARYLLAFCAVTGCDGRWLLTGEGEMKRTPPSEAERRLRIVRMAIEAEDADAIDDLLKYLSGGGLEDAPDD